MADPASVAEAIASHREKVQICCKVPVGADPTVDELQYLADAIIELHPNATTHWQTVESFQVWKLVKHYMSGFEFFRPTAQWVRIGTRLLKKNAKLKESYAAIEHVLQNQEITAKKNPVSESQASILAKSYLFIVLLSLFSIIAVLVSILPTPEL